MVQRLPLFKKGNRVFGYNDIKFGGHAEYLTISEKDAITTMPANLSYLEAAPISEGAHYALHISKAANIKRDHNALVYGATGAIGTAAVQLLNYFEVNVTAICNTKNVALLKTLGAKEVIDYETQNFTQIQQRFDFIFDAVGKSRFKQCKPLLKDKGMFISTELGKNAENVFLALTTPLFGGKKVLFPIATITKEDVEFLKNLVEDKKFGPVIDRIYNLEQITEAYQYVETGKKNR